MALAQRCNCPVKFLSQSKREGKAGLETFKLAVSVSKTSVFITISPKTLPEKPARASSSKQHHRWPYLSQLCSRLPTLVMTRDYFALPASLPSVFVVSGRRVRHVWVSQS